MASRETFSTKTGFILAAAGSAIGLGNIWGFPTKTAGNGGAAFVLVYLILAFCLAYPALMAELVIGRHAKSNAVSALRGLGNNKASRNFGAFVGFYGIIVASLILSFYAIVAGWMLSYLGESVTNLLGWDAASQWLTSDGLARNMIFMTLFMVLTMGIISSGVKGGIEKWSTRLMPMLMVILVLLIIYVLMQDGATDGLKVYLVPDISQIDPPLILNAMGQAFFSMSLGVGTMLIYGSYLSDKESLPELGAWVTVCDVGIAFTAGLLIIPAMFVAQNYGATIYDESGKLIAGGDLIFQVLPVLFNSMGGIGPIVAFAFFALMSIAALTSSISMLEVPVALVSEETRADRKQATIILGAAIFGAASAILLYFGTLFNFVVDFTTKYSQPLLGVALCVFAGWIWNRNGVLKELQKGSPDMENSLFWKIWPKYVQFVCPVLILFAFIQSLA
jgi:NSS family neurotransmitter:Na+ symporter